MTRKDEAITYAAAISRTKGPLHLSEDGEHTLCHRRIRSHWQRYEGRVDLFTLMLAAVPTCIAVSYTHLTLPTSDLV